MQARLEQAIGQPEIAAPVQTEQRRGRRRLALANFRAAVRRRLAVGQVQHADPSALAFEQCHGAARAEFGIVGMRGNEQVIEISHDGLGE